VISTDLPFAPKIIKRVSRTLPTSACTVVVETDCGTGYLKAIGNDEGPSILACELIGTRLAKWFGLSTFDFAIIDVMDYHNIQFHNQNRATPGPAFITRAEQGDQWDGTVKQLKQLSNPEDISRLVIFDTWTLNCDRFSVVGMGVAAKTRRNQGNVFLSEESQPGTLELKAMDHTHCFSCGHSLSQKILGLDTIRDPRVFGVFPEFRTLLVRELVKLAASELRSITKSVIDEITSNVPYQWEVGPANTELLRNLLLGRAAFVADTIEEKLWPQRDILPQSSSDKS